MTGIDRIGLDSHAVIYYLDRTHPYYPLIGWLFQQAEAGEKELVASPVVELEVLVRPYREGDVSKVRMVNRFFSEFPNLTVLKTDRAIAQRAAQLRASVNFSAPDALIVATSLAGDCQGMVGNDRYLADHAQDLHYLYLDSYL